MEPKVLRKDKENGVLLRWDGYLTIPFIQVWNELLQKEDIFHSQNLHIDLRNIQRIDTAGIQWMIYIERLCRQKNINLSFQNHPKPILQILDLYGLIGFFGDKIKITKEESSEYSLSYGTKKEGNGSF
ncbi:STAS domain protein [Leptospira ryugenii]|uniref:STAS domain protein n=1 Tax=Leptospira ryugenii TaxID=1917863 RepID=A0A2P2DWH1_9LEPT|nr:STAS domain-containing protein [Leptospira ryugenii]GBF48981.1 STAS domain protein [Leptospira ryugenii]